ncbi:hypothetical protein Ga0074812_13021 [Parafrankia irregularis]|uniref:Ferritin-like domain-containing protein n=1 Tax=Parafrankia irregularis TaxID=795642 RepID=A0A0S4QWP0_9ACTN|nr:MULTISPECIES: ferritin-like domain-containing protein [Parafrankia]MBE3205767.1 ferritin-like domain-containing protein [Parafrankia sp. CH37]CUU59641.1 hypothetical protein Ga0074812_13021 [Parafrankia irregularis]
MMTTPGRRFEELDPVWVLNQYRAAEIHGAGAILRMSRLADDLALSTDLSRHLRDEAVHAWLWTRALRDIDGEIFDVEEPYQTRLGAHFGIPRTLTDLLALTWVSESRGVEQYESHLNLKDVPPNIRRTLRAILKDETWHVAYIREELERRGRLDPSVQSVIDRAQDADARAVAELALEGDAVSPLTAGAAV